MNRTLTGAVVALLVTATLVTPVAAETDAEPSLEVALEENGDAKVTLTLTYDLDSDAERDAFRTLEDDADARTKARDRFRDRMASVATGAENATDREMSVDDAAIDVSTTADGDTGIVELAVTWRGLAAVDDGALVVTEPFVSGFESDRRVTLVAPEGYELAAASPEPASVGDGRISWDAGTNLDGFEATVVPTDESGGATTDAQATGSSSSASDVPGFGVGLGVVSLLAAAFLARSR